MYVYIYISNIYKYKYKHIYYLFAQQSQVCSTHINNRHYN